jgi:mannose-6-phosphate isomerase-like protein (cupin superfamily)
MSDTSSSATIAVAQAPGAPDAASNSRATVVTPNEGERVRAFGNEILFKLTAAHTGGAFTLGLANAAAGNGPPPHVHLTEDELFIILEGTYRVYANETWSEVGPGSVVYLPRGCAHTFHVTGTTPGKHWVITTPSGFERFYARCAEVFAVAGPPNRSRLEAINEEFGMHFVTIPESQRVA